MKEYRKLFVWQKAHKLAAGAYAASAYLKSPEAWPLRDQLLRATISIPSNIAEGSGRGSDPELRRFLWYSLGSCNELEYDLLLARDLRFLPPAVYEPLAGDVEEVRRMPSGFIATIDG